MGFVDQLSFFSPQTCQAGISDQAGVSDQAGISDLAGLLCGPGQAVAFGRGTAARLSVVLDESWRAQCLVGACAERGVVAEVDRSETGYPLVRTAFRADLTDLAARWLHGAKTVPAEYVPDGAALRVWALTSGAVDRSGFRFGLDPHAPDTHDALANALGALGLPARLLGARADGPALRVTGKRRLFRLAELIGAAPVEAPVGAWLNPGDAAVRDGGSRRSRSAGGTSTGAVKQRANSRAAADAAQGLFAVEELPDVVASDWRWHGDGTCSYLDHVDLNHVGMSHVGMSHAT